MPTRPNTTLALLGSILLIACAACSDSSAGWAPPEREFRDFQVMYPVLLRDCGFHTCHGSSERFFRVFGPGRARLRPDTAAYDAVTGDEISTSFLMALSMIDPEHPERSLLLRKPLAIEAGGAGHEGVDAFGRDIYRTDNDAGYLAIARWVFSMKQGE